uniref:THAP-type domain-containing protein n=1 Tax=Echeneis naucrates TaxID=173247 RepID=A0A665UAJ3_ECHNA
MANACSVFGCGEVNRDTSIHLLPKDHTTPEKWLQFIWNDNVPENMAAKTRVCSKHFEDSCFLNLAQKRMDFTTKLILKHDAFPSVFPGVATAHCCYQATQIRQRR